MSDISDGDRSIIVEREFPYPAEKIWRALTQPHLIEEWLMKNDFKPVVGHAFNLRRTPKPDLNIVIDCKVLIVEPHKSLSYSWSTADLDGFVTWTLTPTATGTRLRMEQSGFRPDQSKAYAGARGGWSHVITAFEEVLARMD
jgi:uncharacterized protein YndB with AHSA1/START domain